MDSISNKICRLYTEAFTPEKVKADLFDHLNTNINGLFRRIDNGYVLNAFIELEEDKYEPVTINDDDEITTIHYMSYCDLGEDVGFTVIIGIGDFIKGKSPNELSLFKVEKCLAKLRYNPDLSSYDIEFYISEHNRKISL
jgi:hypothetical protein